MNTFLVLLLLVSLNGFVLTIPSQTRSELYQAAACNEDVCKLPNCRCSTTSPPGNIEISKIPQFVFLTFDDAVTATNYKTYSELFYGKSNPDGCPIGVTYFVAHEYTDYSKVHDLYLHGHEIALHSISHSPSTPYWRNITVDKLVEEFGDEKTLISHFAQIPEDVISGMRLPFLQLSGSNSYQAAKNIGLKYDCSWPTQRFRSPGLWPYTLDYSSAQDCPIGPCPTDSIPGVWVAPMIMWTDDSDVVCSMTDACVSIPSDVDGLVEWFKKNFNKQYKNNRAPFGFFVHAAWFETDPNHKLAYEKFVDYLQTLPDVYIVNVDRALEWIKNPVPIDSGEWPKCLEPVDLGCSPQVCELPKGEETRYMTVCSDCPDAYPWLGNPLGEA